MKGRKPAESDAEYIARLERAYADATAQKKRWKKSWKRMMGTILPAADKAGQIVQYAAEVTGMKSDHDVKATIEGLRCLASCVWHEDDVTIPDLPALPEAKPDRFGGDAEMILRSAIEQVKQTRPPWEDWSDAVPSYKGVDPSDLDWSGIANEVHDALCDLEFSRGLLRLDLRSVMYDHCFERISRAVREADRRVRDHHDEELSTIPF